MAEVAPSISIDNRGGLTWTSGLSASGNMGAGMANNLIKAGHSLTIHDLVRERGDTAAGTGRQVGRFPQGGGRSERNHLHLPACSPGHGGGITGRGWCAGGFTAGEHLHRPYEQLGQPGATGAGSLCGQGSAHAGRPGQRQAGGNGWWRRGRIPTGETGVGRLRRQRGLLRQHRLRLGLQANAQLHLGGNQPGHQRVLHFGLQGGRGP